MKTVWMTAIGSSEEQVKKLFLGMKAYGLDIKGHFWEDNLEKMAWLGAREEVVKTETALWVILASAEGLMAETIRQGLSLLAISLQAARGLAFPIAIILTDGKAVAPEGLPTPLKSADVLSLADQSLGAKLVARVHGAAKAIVAEYRLDVYGNPQIGLWFEVGPRSGCWRGAIFGVAGGEINFHGVGPKGSLPSQSVLNFPLKGMKLNIGADEYSAWAVQNDIDPETSYFVRVSGKPGSILFAPYSNEEEADAYVISLK